MVEEENMDRRSVMKAVCSSGAVATGIGIGTSTAVARPNPDIELKQIEGTKRKIATTVAKNSYVFGGLNNALEEEEKLQTLF